MGFWVGRKCFKGGGRCKNMKKIVLFGFVLGILVLSSLGVYAVQKEMNYPGTTITVDFTEQNFQFVKGWNLVQGILSPEWIQSNSENIKIIYALNPVIKEYVQFYPNPEGNKIGQTNYRWESFATIGALWIYSDKSFSSRY